MATFEKRNVTYLENEVGAKVKTVCEAKFIRDDAVESEWQRYEVDGEDSAKLDEELQKAADEYNTRTII